MRDFSTYLVAFAEHPNIAQRLGEVLTGLPEDIQNELLTDPHFRISLDDCEPGRGRTVLMAELSPAGASRCVVLKPRLERCSEGFACYIIAHELAHSYLHNGAWADITDPEDAADALAAKWGYEKLPFEW